MPSLGVLKGFSGIWELPFKSFSCVHVRNCSQKQIEVVRIGTEVKTGSHVPVDPGLAQPFSDSQ